MSDDIAASCPHDRQRLQLFAAVVVFVKSVWPENTTNKMFVNLQNAEVQVSEELKKWEIVEASPIP